MIGADYAVPDEIAIRGAVDRPDLALSTIDAPVDIIATGLTPGVSCVMTSAASLPLILSAEYSRPTIDHGGLSGIEPDIDHFALGRPDDPDRQWLAHAAQLQHADGAG